MEKSERVDDDEHVPQEHVRNKEQGRWEGHLWYITKAKKSSLPICRSAWLVTRRLALKESIKTIGTRYSNLR